MATESLAIAPLHAFHDRLNVLLAEAGFDRFVETSCEAYYNDGGRPSIPPGTHGQRAHWVMWVVLVNLRISD